MKKIVHSLRTWTKLGLWVGIVMLFIANIAMRYPGQFIASPTNVLGATTPQKDSLDAEYRFWESIVTEYPEYRDGYLALARLGYMLNKPEEMSESLQYAARLDPNNPTIEIFGALPR